MNKQKKLKHIARQLGDVRIWYGKCFCVYDNPRYKSYGWHYEDNEKRVYLGKNFAQARRKIEFMLKREMR